MSYDCLRGCLSLDFAALSHTGGVREGSGRDRDPGHALGGEVPAGLVSVIDVLSARTSLASFS